MRLLCLLVALALVACAGPGGRGGKVSIETASNGQALVGVSCAVYTNAGSWNVVTPETIALGGAQGDLHVICNYPGYRTAELIYKPSNYAGSAVDVGVAGGGAHTGVGVGLSFPLAVAGAYPARMTVEMHPQ